jgi:hypothetical protein
MEFLEYSVNLNIDLLSEYAFISKEVQKRQPDFKSKILNFRNKLKPLGTNYSTFPS